MRAMEISRTGLDVEWRRLEIIAENLANISTSSAPGKAVYQARRLSSGPATGFATQVDGTVGAGTPGEVDGTAGFKTVLPVLCGEITPVGNNAMQFRKVGG